MPHIQNRKTTGLRINRLARRIGVKVWSSIKCCRQGNKWHLEWPRSVLKAAGVLETTAAAFPMGSATALSPSLD